MFIKRRGSREGLDRCVFATGIGELHSGSPGSPCKGGAEIRAFAIQLGGGRGWGRGQEPFGVHVYLAQKPSLAAGH